MDCSTTLHVQTMFQLAIKLAHEAAPPLSSQAGLAVLTSPVWNNGSYPASVGYMFKKKKQAKRIDANKKTGTRTHASRPAARLYCCCISRHPAQRREENIKSGRLLHSRRRGGAALRPIRACAVERKRVATMGLLLHRRDRQTRTRLSNTWPARIQASVSAAAPSNPL